MIQKQQELALRVISVPRTINNLNRSHMGNSLNENTSLQLIPLQNHK